MRQTGELDSELVMLTMFTFNTLIGYFVKALAIPRVLHSMRSPKFEILPHFPSSRKESKPRQMLKLASISVSQLSMCLTMVEEF